MNFTIYNLPGHATYSDIESFICQKSGLSDFYLDNLHNDGDNSKVNISLPNERDAAYLFGKINGLFLYGKKLFMENIGRQKHPSLHNESSYSNASRTSYDQPFYKDSSIFSHDEPVNQNNTQFEQQYVSKSSYSNDSKMLYDQQLYKDSSRFSYDEPVYQNNTQFEQQHVFNPNPQVLIRQSYFLSSDDNKCRQIATTQIAEQIMKKFHNNETDYNKHLQYLKQVIRPKIDAMLGYSSKVPQREIIDGYYSVCNEDDNRKSYEDALRRCQTHDNRLNNYSPKQKLWLKKAVKEIVKNILKKYHTEEIDYDLHYEQLRLFIRDRINDILKYGVELSNKQIIAEYYKKFGEDNDHIVYKATLDILKTVKYNAKPGDSTTSNIQKKNSETTQQPQNLKAQPVESQSGPSSQTTINKPSTSKKPPKNKKKVSSSSQTKNKITKTRKSKYLKSDPNWGPEVKKLKAKMHKILNKARKCNSVKYYTIFNILRRKLNRFTKPKKERIYDPVAEEIRINNIPQNLLYISISSYPHPPIKDSLMFFLKDYSLIKLLKSHLRPMYIAKIGSHAHFKRLLGKCEIIDGAEVYFSEYGRASPLKLTRNEKIAQAPFFSHLDCEVFDIYRYKKCLKNIRMYNSARTRQDMKDNEGYEINEQLYEQMDEEEPRGEEEGSVSDEDDISDEDDMTGEDDMSDDDLDELNYDVEDNELIAQDKNNEEKADVDDVAVEENLEHELEDY